MLRRRDVVALGRVHDDDAVLGRGSDVHVVDADSGATDDPQALRGRQHIARDLRARSDRKAVDIGDQLEQLVRGDAGSVDDLDPGRLLQDRHALFGEGIGNEDFRHPSLLHVMSVGPAGPLGVRRASLFSRSGRTRSRRGCLCLVCGHAHSYALASHPRTTFSRLIHRVCSGRTGSVGDGRAATFATGSSPRDLVVQRKPVARIGPK